MAESREAVKASIAGRANGHTALSRVVLDDQGRVTDGVALVEEKDLRVDVFTAKHSSPLHTICGSEVIKPAVGNPPPAI